MKIEMFCFAVLLAISVVICTGCTSSAGWRVSFGVSPVTSIDDRATLLDHKTPNTKTNY